MCNIKHEWIIMLQMLITNNLPYSVMYFYFYALSISVQLMIKFNESLALLGALLDFGCGILIL